MNRKDMIISIMYTAGSPLVAATVRKKTLNVLNTLLKPLQEKLVDAGAHL